MHQVNLIIQKELHNSIPNKAHRNRSKKTCLFLQIQGKLLLKERKIQFRIRIKIFLKMSESKVVGTTQMETRKIELILKIKI
jgi:hypothetical protein